MFANPSSVAAALMMLSKRSHRSAPIGDGQSSAWYVPHRAIIVLGLMLTLVAVAGGTLGVVNSARAEGAITTVSDRYLVLQPPVRKVRAAVAAFQVLAEEAFVGSTSNTALLTSAVADSERH